MSRMGLYEQIDAAVEQALGRGSAAARAGEAVPAKDALHGDVTLTAAMVQAERLEVAPRALAARLVEALGALEGVSGASVAGGGFVNVKLTQAFVAASLTPEALAPERGTGPVAVLQGLRAGPREAMSAAAAVRLADALGQTVVQELSAPVDVTALLQGLVGPEARFGAASEAEFDGLAAELGQITGALETAARVSFFAPRGAGLRPGLYEAATEGRALCTGLAEAMIPEGLSESEAQLARLYVLCHRADRALDMTARPFLQPDQSNPAFLLHYAASRLASLTAAGPLDWSEETRRLALHLAYFPKLLALADRLAAPHRLGLFLLEASQLLLAAQAAGQKRGEKAICAEVIDACEVVFSRGFAILGTTPLAEIT